MKLELIISPSGFGKTHFIVNDIEKNRFNRSEEHTSELQSQR